MSINVESTIVRYTPLDTGFKYESNKSIDDNVNDLLKVYDMKPVSNSQLEAIIGENIERFSMSSVTRTPAEREAALQRNQRAQQLIARSIVSAAKAKYELSLAMPESTTLLNREAIFLRQGDTSDALDFNKRLANARRDNPAEFARLQYQALEEARIEAGITSPQQLSALYDAPEDELLDNFPALNRYVRMLAETQNLAKNEALTPEQRANVQKYQVGMNLAGVLESRMDLMANPLYPDINPNPLFRCGVYHDQISVSITGKIPDEDLGRTSPVHHPLTGFFGSLSSFASFYSSGILDRAALLYPGLKNATFNQQTPDFSLNDLLVAHTARGEDIVVTNRMPLLVQTAQEHTKSLYEETVKADKRLLTGSRQFDQMMAAEKALVDLQRQDNLPSREMTSDRAGELAKKAMEYLQYKLEGKGVYPPYTAESVKNLGKNKREQSRLDVAAKILTYAQAQKAAVDTSLKNEQLLKDVSVNINASRRQRSAFSSNLHQQTIADVADNELRHPGGKPPSREEFAALVLLACGSRKVAGSNPETSYSNLVKDVIFEGKAPTSQQAEMLSRAKTMVKDAIKNGNGSLLSELVSDGLQQNNKMLQKSTALDDKFCFLADLGGKAVQTAKNYSGLMGIYLQDKDKLILNAAKAISNMRAKGLEVQRDGAYRFGQDIEDKTDSHYMASVCQMYGVNKLLASGNMDLANSPYGKIPGYAELCNQELRDSKTITKFCFKDAAYLLTAIQDPKQMTELHDNIIKELHDKALEAQQKQQPQLQNELPANTIQQQQPKAATPTMTNG